MYAMPVGVKCLVAASGGVTTLRDKAGAVITTVNTFLPNGNAASQESKLTLLQGVYNPSIKLLYITDILMWDEDLLIDLTGYARLQIAFEKINDIPAIGREISKENELMVRFPNIYYCSKEALRKAYYGLFLESENAEFKDKYNELIDYVVRNELIDWQTIMGKEVPAVCAAIGYDNLGQPYVKDGIAFVHKEGNFVFGLSAECLIWKNEETSPIHFKSLARRPITAKLIYTNKGRLRTYDGYNIAVCENSSPLAVNTRYLVEFEDAVVLDNWQIKLRSAKVVKEVDTVVWDTAPKIAYKCMVAKGETIKYADIEKVLA